MHAVQYMHAQRAQRAHLELVLGEHAERLVAAHDDALEALALLDGRLHALLNRGALGLSQRLRLRCAVDFEYAVDFEFES